MSDWDFREFDAAAGRIVAHARRDAADDDNTPEMRRDCRMFVAEIESAVDRPEQQAIIRRFKPTWDRHEELREERDRQIGEGLEQLLHYLEPGQTVGELFRDPRFRNPDGTISAPSDDEWKAQADKNARRQAEPDCGEWRGGEA